MSWSIAPGKNMLIGRKSKYGSWYSRYPTHLEGRGRWQPCGKGQDLDLQDFLSFKRNLCPDP